MLKTVHIEEIIASRLKEGEGNLLLLGTLPSGDRTLPVIGAAGCARSPKKNGFVSCSSLRL